MQEGDELIRQADKLRQAKCFDEALLLYRQLWAIPGRPERVREGWGYAYCLQKSGDYASGLQVARQVFRLAPEFVPNRRVYAWCIYKLEIQKANAEIHQNPARFMRAARAILLLAPSGKYQPTARTVLRVAAYLRTRRPYPAELILAWLERLDPQELSRQPVQMARLDDPAGERPSELEEWLCEKCRALFHLHRDEELRALAAIAFHEIPRFHAKNDWWLSYRLALAEGRCGNLAGEVAQLEKLLPGKPDWHILNELALRLFQLDRLDEAVAMAAAALLQPAEPARKAELVFRLGSHLAEQPGQETLALQHLALAARLYANNRRPLPAALRALLNARRLHLDNLPATDALYLSLESYWQQLKVSRLTVCHGTVQKIQPQGQAGWVVAENGHAYRFQIRDFLGSPTLLRPGLPVWFRLAPGDSANGQQAVYIQYVPKHTITTFNQYPKLLPKGVDRQAKIDNNYK